MKIISPGTLHRKGEEAKKLAGDEHLGKFVYCKQHVGPHATGWCTVRAEEKIPLKATNIKEAGVEVRALGLPIFGEDK